MFSVVMFCFLIIQPLKELKLVRCEETAFTIPSNFHKVLSSTYLTKLNVSCGNGIGDHFMYMVGKFCTNLKYA